MNIALKLRNAEARYRASAEAAEDRRAARNAVVLTAIENGWSHAKIAEATGLSRARIGQIALTRDRVEAAGSGG